jgi:hypothetical protein
MPTIKFLAEADPHKLEDVVIEELYNTLADRYVIAMRRGKGNIDRFARSQDFTQRIRQAACDVLGL